jgi:hypothetical protein
MRILIVAGVAMLTAGAAIAQTAADLKGTWSGTWRTVIFGNNPHHTGTQTVSDPPRIREITFTLEVQGQDGRLLWGQAWSDPSRKEPFAATIAADGKTIVGADTDGALSGTIAAPDLLELCYTHNATSPSQSIVASCGSVKRSQ